MNLALLFLLLLGVAGLISLAYGISQMETREHQTPITPGDLDELSEQDRTDHIERWR